MRILLADKMTPGVLDAMASAGFEVASDPTLAGAALVAAVAEFQPHVLVVRSTKVDASALGASRSLELVVRAGAGYDTIDVETASSRGVFVANCPGKNASAVAELTLGLIIGLDRLIPDNVADARAGRWAKGRYSKARGLSGRTLGVVGLGNIGREVAARAAAFGLRVVAWSRSLSPERAEALGVEPADSPLAVAAVADIVTLHVAATADTAQLADHAFFEAMQEGAFFVNTTRSSVVDEEALLWALDNKEIRAALDVVSDEPAAKEGPFSHRLAEHPAVHITHHIGASTEQAQAAIADEAFRIIQLYEESGEVQNCVNLARQTRATHQLTVRHLNKVGVLAAVLKELQVAGWNVQEMQNRVFQGGTAAVAHIRFDGELSDGVLDPIRESENVIAVTIIDL